MGCAAILPETHGVPMICVFVQFRCTPSKTYEVATAIYDREVVSELYSTSGEYDLIAKIYIPDDADVGHYLSERLFDISGIVRTLTTMTFKAF
jgi:DNA-binding Lrp family transcriptional regulator